MRFFETLLVVAVVSSLVAKAIVYPRAPRSIDAIVLGAGVLAVFHVALEGARTLFVPLYLVEGLLLLGALLQRRRARPVDSRGWGRRLAYRATAIAAVGLLLSMAGLVTLLTPLSKDPDNIVSALASSPLDVSSLGWTDAFDSLHRHLQRDYAFGEWKGIDWNGLAERLRPRIAAAETAGDFGGYYDALREYAFSFPDGHVGLEGDDRGRRAAAIGGGFGLGLVRLDDGSAMVHVLLADGPAARAGVQWGARVLSWNGAPVDEAASRVPILWADTPPATREGRRLLQYRLLPRAPVGTRVELVVSNPGETEPRTVSLTAMDDGLEEFDRTEPHPEFRGREPVVSSSILPGNVAYLRILAEMPTLGGLFPDREVRRAMEGFSRLDVDKLVLDVRGNRGGFDKLVPEMMGFFFDTRGLYEKVAFDRDGSGFRVFPDKTLWVEPRRPRFSGNVVVLVDGRTLSSGEGFPMLARRIPRAHIVGWNGTHGSFGMSGRAVRLPEALTFTYPNGRSLDENEIVQVDANGAGEGGVEPDIRVPVTEETIRAQWLDGRDVALETAVALLTGRR